MTQTQCSTPSPSLPNERRSNVRVASIDVMRSITMLLMLFVNDIPGLKGVPHWMFHAAHDEDMLGFSDTIFPAFLFCVGLSIPFAIDHRLSRGDSQFQVLGHIFRRTFALLAMGLFTLNGERGAGGIDHKCYSLLMVAGLFLVWMDYARNWNRWFVRLLQAVGAAILVGLILYSDIHGQPFRFGWWGILGLIGWTYMVCALAYLLARRSLCGVLVAWIAGVLLCVVSNSSLIPHDWFSRIVLLPFVPAGWTGHALGLSGMAAAMLMRQESLRRGHRLLGLFVLLGLVMLALGIVTHQHWIISKIQATPPWLFFCTTIFFPMLALLYWLVDVRGKASWFSLIAPAGTATLTCYLLPYAWYPLRSMLGFHFPWSWYHGMPGLLLSLGYALIVVQAVRLLLRLHVKVKV
ncbi:MAG: DUF5009 domain-containing protein [Bacteroidaceae bacterium]|nr:DUF5009 domain-containing protein [Bacteroidaceae bacterium]